MQAFDEVHRAIHYPPDHRFRVWMNPWFILAFAVVAFAPVPIAWCQYLINGLPTETFLPPINLRNPLTPHGFPALRLTHFVNFLFSDAPGSQAVTARRKGLYDGFMQTGWTRGSSIGSTQSWAPFSSLDSHNVPRLRRKRG